MELDIIFFYDFSCFIIVFYLYQLQLGLRNSESVNICKQEVITFVLP